MFSLFDDVQYEFDLLWQGKGYEDEYEYVGSTTMGRSIRVYIVDDENDETTALSNMSDISLNVPVYFLEYQRDGHMLVLTDVMFLEVEDDFCFLESKRNGFGRVYRISKGDFIWKAKGRSD